MLLRRTTPTTPAQRVVRVFRIGVTTTALALTAGTMVADVLSPPHPVGAAAPLDLSKSNSRLFEHNRCSTTGFKPDVMPARAMVRRTTGETVVVSFDEGWSVFTGQAPGELVATCLGPVRPAPDLTN